ncbi:thiamine pyrophosphate-binding protein [Limnohabitans sp. Rim8]|uniref:thiamine pyrophosphate-binding protein n=1 Tax=Limnohabitans sp. Rim8 TaxID=1100718 RepID=UPI0033061A2A
MTIIKAYELVGRTLARLGVDTGFFLMGGPTHGAGNACIANGIRLIDVRHEQAAAYMAQAYARVSGKPGFCMAASGPGIVNLAAGLMNALVDCAPVIAIGGASPIGQSGKGAFQDIDQLAVMKPATKWAERVTDPLRIPEMIAAAYLQAMSGKRGPAYLDLPGDVLYRDVDEAAVFWPGLAATALAAPAATQDSVERMMELLAQARRPVIVSGSGVIWSGASAPMRAFVEQAGIPFYTTPQGRGVVPDDHALSFPAVRTRALKDADLVIVLGTRLNYIWNHGEAPRFSADAQFVRVDIDPAEAMIAPRLALGIAADCATVLRQWSEALGSSSAGRYAAWTRELAASNQPKLAKAEAALATEAVPIHPQRLCKEVRDFIDRDAVLVVDGQEILNFARQSIPTFQPGHRLNSGPFGTMGVGLPFALGAKAARPDTQVVVVHGDGSFGFNAMELDTAIRHKLPVLVVISLNGGWTADPQSAKPGRHLGYVRYDLMAEALGCHGEYVEAPDEIRPALERAAAAVRAGQAAVVNVKTDPNAGARTAEFTSYVT